MPDMKIILTILTFLTLTLATGQNLVTNGGFETYSLCPTTKSTSGNLQIAYANGWHAAASTPDYYNACAGISTGVNEPYSNFGYQQDCCGGSGYAGGFMISRFATNNDDREYIYTKLIDTLKAGHKYLASMYVSRADGWDYAVATIGMLFTDTVINLIYPQSFISAIPQIKNTTVLSDTLNWMLIQDTLTAIGNETYLTIGNFNTSATCDSVNVGGNGTHSSFGYYFIDGVSVIDIGTTSINQINSKSLFQIYPNPTSDQSTLQFDNTKAELCTLTLYNNCGQIVRTINNITSDQVVIQKNNLTSGLYYFVLRTSDRVIVTGKLAVD